MLTVIMQRLTALEQSGEMGRKMDAFKERVIRNSLRPPAVPGIGRTEKYGSRLFDPSVRLAADTVMPSVFWHRTVRRWPLCPGRAVQPGSVSGWLNWS